MEKTLRDLALYAAKGSAPENFSVADANAAFRGELAKIAGNINNFNKNKYDIFSIMIEVIDEIVPKNVIDALGIFAEVRQAAQGEKVTFRQKVGKTRARRFLTQVGLSGVYETFRLDNVNFEVPVTAVGGAGTIDFERLLDGSETLQDVMDVLTDGLTNAIYLEVQKALVAAINAVNRPAANKYSGAGFDSEEMVKLMNVVRAYSDNVVIFTSPEFATEMGPDAIVPVGTNYQGVYHPDDIDRVHYQGYINIFRGAPIITLPQSFIDENNEKTWINPRFAYILPAGQERIVKVVLEGQTQMWDEINKDQSIEINVYKKMGAAILSNHNWAVYENTSIADTSASPYGM